MEQIAIARDLGALSLALTAVAALWRAWASERGHGRHQAEAGVKAMTEMAAAQREMAQEIRSTRAAGRSWEEQSAERHTALVGALRAIEARLNGPREERL